MAERPEDWRPPWAPDPSIPNFPARLRWIVEADYAAEGLSAALPLLLLAMALEEAARLVQVAPDATEKLARLLAALDSMR